MVSDTKQDTSTQKRKYREDEEDEIVKEKKRLKIQTVAEDYAPAKSKKELRAERKAQKLQENLKDELSIKRSLTKEEKKEWRKRQKKNELREQRILLIKEQREAKKLRKIKRLHKEMNASGGADTAKEKKLKHILAKEQCNPNKVEHKEEESNMKVLNSLFQGAHDDTTGMTVMRMGVQYSDVIVGKGRAAQEKDLVTVRYKLQGGKFGAVIDSSKKFTFRIGKGEVIKGWDIGVIGMQEGGQRHLIVPPKAGYGSQDIGAGPGATLFFDITLLSMK